MQKLKKLTDKLKFQNQEGEKICQKKSLLEKYFLRFFPF